MPVCHLLTFYTLGFIQDIQTYRHPKYLKKSHKKCKPNRTAACKIDEKALGKLDIYCDEEKQKMDVNTRLHRKMTVNESKTTHSFYCFSGRATTTNIPFQTPTVVCHRVCVPMSLVSFLHSFDVLMEAFSFALCSLFPDLRKSSNSD